MHPDPESAVRVGHQMVPIKYYGISYVIPKLLVLIILKNVNCFKDYKSNQGNTRKFSMNNEYIVRRYSQNESSPFLHSLLIFLKNPINRYIDF